MSSRTSIEAITALFETSIEDMPRISTSASKPKYTSINTFQEAIDANSMTITSYTMKLGHLALTRKTAVFRVAKEKMTSYHLLQQEVRP